ncbi:ML domain-containing protein [Flagelloscypha sp. PMI_526]|nr:ML domain-containing protein [Flagelloscypha sp. PMI_526]
MRPTVLGCLALSLFGTVLADQIPVVPNGAVKAVSDAWSWENCGLPTDIIEVQSLEVSPDPPVPGQTLTVTATGVAKEVVEDGAQADVTVKLGLIKLIQKTFDICDEAAKANATIQCPIEAREHVVVQSVDLPKEIPQAKFLVNVQAYTVDDEDLLCLNLAIDFRKHASFFPFL